MITREEAIANMHQLTQQLPHNVPVSTQLILIAYHNKYGGRAAVAALCRVFEVECRQGDEICGTCATEGVNRAMDAIAFKGANAPTSVTVQ